MLVIPSASEKTLADHLLGVVVPGNQKYKLYVNDVTPDDASVAASFTEMSSLSYAEKTLTKTAWVGTAGGGGQPCTSVQALQTWTFTNSGAEAAVDVYGYFVVDATSGLLLWAERFTNPKTVENTGDVVKITPKFTTSRT